MKYLYLLFFAPAFLMAADPKPMEATSDKLVGNWESIGGEMNGVQIEGNIGKTIIEFDKEQITLNGGKAVKYTIDNTKTPATLDIHTTPKQVGILKFVNGQLHLCFAREGQRPTQFKSDAGDDCIFLVMTKI
jgi:uncharacterized protein (TIGR03067 family)